MTLDELMSRLLQTHEQYTAQLAVELTEEDARAERDAVKREQDLAFQESLKVRSNPNPSPAKDKKVFFIIICPNMILGRPRKTSRTRERRSGKTSKRS